MPPARTVPATWRISISGSIGDDKGMVKRDRILLGEIESDLLDGKPLADVLRKVIMLRGRADSGAMRDGHRSNQRLRRQRRADTAVAWCRVRLPGLVSLTSSAPLEQGRVVKG